MSEIGDLRKFGVDMFALQHFSQDPPDIPNGILLIDGEPYQPGGGGGSDYTHPNHTGDVTSVGDGETTIASGAVTNAKMANMAQDTLKGRIGSDGAPEDLTPAEVRAMINVADGANAYTHPNHSGDVTSVADGAQTIASDAVTNTKLANMSQNTIKGRITASAGDPEDLTATQVRTLINVADGANAYVHPNHTGDVTSVTDGTQTIASDAVTNVKLANMAQNTLKGRVTASTGDPEDLTAAQARSILNVADGANNYTHPNHTGEVTSTADGAQVLANTAVTNRSVVTPAGADHVLIYDASGATIAKALISAWPITRPLAVLTDGATVAVNSDNFLNGIGKLTLGGNRTLSAPTGSPVSGQTIEFWIIQDATGSRTITWNAAYKFTGVGGTPTLTTTANAVDILTFQYYATTGVWMCTAIIKNAAV